MTSEISKELPQVKIEDMKKIKKKKAKSKNPWMREAKWSFPTNENEKIKRPYLYDLMQKKL